MAVRVASLEASLGLRLDQWEANLRKGAGQVDTFASTVQSKAKAAGSAFDQMREKIRANEATLNAVGLSAGKLEGQILKAMRADVVRTFTDSVRVGQQEVGLLSRALAGAAATAQQAGINTGFLGQAIGALTSPIGLVSVGVAAMLAGMYKSIAAVTENARQVKALMAVSGLAADEADNLADTFEVLGKDTTVLTSALFKMGQEIDSGGKGLRDLGIDLRKSSGELKTEGELFLEVRDRISQMSSASERSAAIMALFGRAGRELADVFAMSRGEFEKWSGKAGEVSAWTQEQQQAASDYARQVALLSKQWEGFWIALGTPLVSTGAEFLSWLNDGISKLKTLGDLLVSADLAYTRFLANSPRLAPLLGGPDAQDAAIRRLRDAGLTTDTSVRGATAGAVVDRVPQGAADAIAKVRQQLELLREVEEDRPLLKLRQDFQEFAEKWGQLSPAAVADMKKVYDGLMALTRAEQQSKATEPLSNAMRSLVDLLAQAATPEPINEINALLTGLAAAHRGLPAFVKMSDDALMKWARGRAVEIVLYRDQKKALDDLVKTWADAETAWGQAMQAGAALARPQNVPLVGDLLPQIEAVAAAVDNLADEYERLTGKTRSANDVWHTFFTELGNVDRAASVLGRSLGDTLAAKIRATEAAAMALAEQLARAREAGDETGALRLANELGVLRGRIADLKGQAFSEELAKIGREAALLGPDFDALAAHLGAVKKRMLEVAEATRGQMTPELAGLKSEFDRLNEAVKTRDLFRDLFGAITGGIEQVVRGLQQGTLSWKSFGDIARQVIASIAADLINRLLKQALGPVIDALGMVFAGLGTASSARQAAGIASAGVGGIGDPNDLLVGTSQGAGASNAFASSVGLFSSGASAFSTGVTLFKHGTTVWNAVVAGWDAGFGGLSGAASGFVSGLDTVGASIGAMGSTFAAVTAAVSIALTALREDLTDAGKAIISSFYAAAAATAIGTGWTGVGMIVAAVLAAIGAILDWTGIFEKASEEWLKFPVHLAATLGKEQDALKAFGLAMEKTSSLEGVAKTIEGFRQSIQDEAGVGDFVERTKGLGPFQVPGIPGATGTEHEGGLSFDFGPYIQQMQEAIDKVLGKVRDTISVTFADIATRMLPAELAAAFKTGMLGTLRKEFEDLVASADAGADEVKAFEERMKAVGELIAGFAREALSLREIGFNAQAVLPADLVGAAGQWADILRQQLVELAKTGTATAEDLDKLGKDIQALAAGVALYHDLTARVAALRGDYAAMTAAAIASVNAQRGAANRVVQDAVTQLSGALAGPEMAAAADQLRQAIIAKFDLERQLVAQIEAQTNQLLDSWGSLLLEARAFGVGQAIDQGDTRPLLDGIRALDALATASNSAALSLWAVTTAMQAVAAAVPRVVAAGLVPSFAELTRGVVDALAPSVAALKRMYDDARAAGDLETAVALLARGKELIVANYQALIAGINQMAEAQIAAHRRALDVINTYGGQLAATATAYAATRLELGDATGFWNVLAGLQAVADGAQSIALKMWAAAAGINAVIAAIPAALAGGLIPTTPNMATPSLIRQAAYAGLAGPFTTMQTAYTQARAKGDPELALQILGQAATLAQEAAAAIVAGIKEWEQAAIGAAQAGGAAQIKALENAADVRLKSLAREASLNDERLDVLAKEREVAEAIEQAAQAWAQIRDTLGTFIRQTTMQQGPPDVYGNLVNAHTFYQQAKATFAKDQTPENLAKVQQAAQEYLTALQQVVTRPDPRYAGGIKDAGLPGFDAVMNELKGFLGLAEKLATPEQQAAASLKSIDAEIKALRERNDVLNKEAQGIREKLAEDVAAVNRQTELTVAEIRAAAAASVRVVKEDLANVLRAIAIEQDSILREFGEAIDDAAKTLPQEIRAAADREIAAINALMGGVMGWIGDQTESALREQVASNLALLNAITGNKPVQAFLAHTALRQATALENLRDFVVAALKGEALPEIVTVPALAGGGVVTKPTFALIGEGGPEAVVPLSEPWRHQRFATAMAMSLASDRAAPPEWAGASGRGGGVRDVHVHVHIAPGAFTNVRNEEAFIARMADHVMATVKDSLRHGELYADQHPVGR